MAMSADYRKPLPNITPLNRPFWEHARAHRLAVQVCDRCSDIHYPESPVCPKCLSQSQSWKPVSGHGTLESWVDFYRAYWDGFTPNLPYRTCLVKLAEGPLFVSNLVGDSAAAKLGAPVRVVFEDVTDEVSLAKFALA
jgi:uncharacterized OB-fold protein